MTMRQIPLALAWVTAIFLVAPIAIIVPMSFSSAISFEFPPPGYWTGYYTQYFTSHSWLEATANSFIIAFGTMAFTLIVALPAAFGFVRYRFHGKSALNLVMMLPIIVPAVVSALGYYSFLSLAYLVGTHAGMIIAHSVLSIPVAFLVISAALKGFDRNLERAAMSAGAGPLRTFLWVTLPVLRPGILVGALFAFLHSFNEAVVAIFIGGRDAATLPKKMFESIRPRYRRGIDLADRRGAGRRARLVVLPTKASARKRKCRLKLSSNLVRSQLSEPRIVRVPGVPSSNPSARSASPGRSIR
jgi:putative spermidine/putrescine transport system permease protein